MGEIRDLIGIYGAIDRAVDESGRRDSVSRLLPDYDHLRTHWFDEFESWASKRRPDPSQDLFPTLEEALKDLGTIAPRGRMRARRLFAIALATQAFPELLERGHARFELARDALQVEGLAAGKGQAEHLLRLLGDEQKFARIDSRARDGRDEWWQSVADAVTPPADRVMRQPPLGPRPCSGRLVMVGADPVATLESRFEADIPFERAIRFLEPENWPDCSDFWCEMTRLGVLESGVHEYHELVSTDCANRDAAWTVRAELDFRFSEIPGELAVAKYRLRDGYPKQGDDVLVDEGSLIVKRIATGGAPRVGVTTTKRIRFSHPFSGEALALIMCATGYGYVVEDLVFSCASEGSLGTDFPGAPAATYEATGAEGAEPEFAPAIADLAEHVANSVKACIDDCVKAGQASSEKLARGTYSADALVQDMTSMWVRMLREGATAADLGVRYARVAARARGREPPTG